MPGNQDVTLREVAAAAGVSVATVSRVLNGKAPVDIRTSERVQEAVSRLGYDTSQLRSTRQGTEHMHQVLATAEGSRRVEIVLCPLREQRDMLDLPFMSELLRGIQSVLLRQPSWSVNLSTWVVGDGEQESQERALILGRLLSSSGVLVVGNPQDELVSELSSREGPPVVYTPNVTGGKGILVCGDDFGGGLRAGRELLALGHRRIGFLGMEVVSHRLRQHGVLAAMQEAGLADGFSCRSCATTDNADVRDCVESWLAAGDMPEAMVTSCVASAEVLDEVLARHGLRCPEQVSIVTFDQGGRLPGGGAFSHLRTFPRRQGELAAELLSDWGRWGKVAGLKVELELEWVSGDSVASPSKTR